MASTTTPTDARASGNRRWWIVGILGCALGVAFALWWAIATAREVSFQTVSYVVVDDRTVDVTYDVTGPDGRPVTCLVQALDQRFGSVGSAQVSFPARAAGGTQRRTSRLRTTHRAVTGLVKTCAPS